MTKTEWLCLIIIVAKKRLKIVKLVTGIECISISSEFDQCFPSVPLFLGYRGERDVSFFSNPCQYSKAV